MPFELPRKEITVSGETLIVHQASNLMNTKRDLMIAEANERWKVKDVDGTEAQAQRYLEVLLYPSLAACTTGNVPTLEEFMHGVSVEDTVVWENAVSEHNPRWLNRAKDQTPEEQAEELEKKES